MAKPGHRDWPATRCTKIGCTRPMFSRIAKQGYSPSYFAIRSSFLFRCREVRHRGMVDLMHSCTHADMHAVEATYLMIRKIRVLISFCFFLLESFGSYRFYSFLRPWEMPQSDYDILSPRARRPTFCVPFHPEPSQCAHVSRPCTLSSLGPVLDRPLATIAY